MPHPGSRRGPYQVAGRLVVALGAAREVPERWGRVTLSNLRLGPATVNLTANGDRATVRGLPGDWTEQD